MLRDFVDLALFGNINIKNSFFHIKIAKNQDSANNAWNNDGNNALSNSLYPGYIKGKSKVNIGFLKFAKPYSKDKFHFRAGLSFSDYDVKNLDNVKEVGLGLGVGIEFGLMRNQIDISYNLVDRNNIHNIGSETVQSFNVGVSIGDLWFVKRRKI